AADDPAVAAPEAGDEEVPDAVAAVEPAGPEAGDEVPEAASSAARAWAADIERSGISGRKRMTTKPTTMMAEATMKTTLIESEKPTLNGWASGAASFSRNDVSFRDAE